MQGNGPGKAQSVLDRQELCHIFAELQAAAEVRRQEEAATLMPERWPHQGEHSGLNGKEILGVAIIAELDAINLYEHLAALTDNPKVRALFLDIAKGKKTHVGQFQTMLLHLDEEQVKEMAPGKEEAEELTGE